MSVVERDSAGIHIVENPPFDSATATWWSIGDTPALSIGSAEGDDARTLFRVTDAHRLADGRIVVVNGGTAEIRIFSAAGEPLATWGGRGDGPGEFGAISRVILLPADSLLVFDRSKRRVTILGPDGTFARDFVVPARPFGGYIDRFSDGTLVVDDADIDFNARDGRRRPATRFLVQDAAGSVIDSIGPFDGPDMRFHVRGQNGRMNSIEVQSIIFGATTVATVTGAVIWVGTQDAPELRAFEPDGRILRIARIGGTLVPVTDEVRGSVIAAGIARAEATVPPDRLPAVRAGWENREMAEMIPPYGSLRTDARANIWVAEYSVSPAQPRLWTVFDPRGVRIAAIRLREGMRVLEPGDDWLLVLERDDLDVEYVRLYDLLHD